MTHFATTAVVCLLHIAVSLTGTVAVAYIYLTGNYHHGPFIGAISLLCLLALCFATGMMWAGRLHNAWRTER